ncbi:AraC family transcriptional regulator [Solimonas sp. K1W22B-7]|uniref:AraC family transcriptional regulator n=1 Tax=Solimonas sp. K1W22B-7 TaxID=2303331 RepID=UPI0013C3F2E1|nr:AraC family transcriptional regulator [Solimonas sp. K1W22B-7]
MTIKPSSGAAGGQISARFGAGLLEQLRLMGIAPEDLLPPQRLREIRASDARTQMPLSEWVAIMEGAVHVSGDPDLALKAGAGIKPGQLGLLGHVLMSCATVGEAIRQAGRYLRLLHAIGGAEPVIRDGQLEVPMSWTDGTLPSPLIAQFRLAACAGMGRWLTGLPELRMDAWFQFPAPQDLSIYQRVFGGRLHFDQAQTKLAHPVDYLQLPVAMADPAMQQLAQAQAETLLRELATESAFLQELDAVLTRGLPLGRVSLAETAAALRLSTRTLHRRLEEEGTAFRAELDRVRRRIAETLLRDPRVTLADIAFLLGYTEQSTFQQAFKRWTGKTPGQYRSQQ